MEKKKTEEGKEEKRKEERSRRRERRSSFLWSVDKQWGEHTVSQCIKSLQYRCLWLRLLSTSGLLAFSVGMCQAERLSHTWVCNLCNYVVTALLDGRRWNKEVSALCDRVSRVSDECLGRSEIRRWKGIAFSLHSRRKPFSVCPFTIECPLSRRRTGLPSW